MAVVGAHLRLYTPEPDTRRAAPRRALYAVDGAIIAWFDPLLIESGASGSDPDSIVPGRADLPFCGAAPRAASFALAERLLGTALDHAWLDAPHPCVDVRPLPERR